MDTGAVDEILERHDYDPKALLAILEETQAEYGYLPVGALKHISRVTGAWYARSTAPRATTATCASSRR